MSDYRECLTFRVAMSHPGDTSGIDRLVAGGALAAADIVAIFGKTEGNGCVNDFTRAFATEALKSCLARHLGSDPESVAARVPLVMSGGTEGCLSPHFLVIAARAASRPPTGKALAVGTGFTRAFMPEEIGRHAMVMETAEAVRRAIVDAGIDSANDVHFVQIKCPLLTGDRVEAAKARGQTVVTEYTYPSMGYSRAAAALGIAVALGEIAPERITDKAVGSDFSLWSARASTSAGIELTRCEITLGCAGMTALAARLAGELGLPVIDGVVAGVKLLEALVGLGLKTSKVGGYAKPIPKSYKGLLKPFAPK